MNTNRHHEADPRSAMPDNLFPLDIEDPKQAGTLLAGENRLLEMLATGCTLTEFLDALCRLIEDIASGSLCGIVLVDPIGNRLQRQGDEGGQVAGFSQWCGSASCQRAFVWEDGVLTELSGLDTRHGYVLARGLNSRGDVVGSSRSSAGRSSGSTR